MSDTSWIPPFVAVVGFVAAFIVAWLRDRNNPAAQSVQMANDTTRAIKEVTDGIMARADREIAALHEEVARLSAEVMRLRRILDWYARLPNIPAPPESIATPDPEG